LRFRKRKNCTSACPRKISSSCKDETRKGHILSHLLDLKALHTAHLKHKMVCNFETASKQS
jgi:hypothetical protein